MSTLLRDKIAAYACGEVLGGYVIAQNSRITGADFCDCSIREYKSNFLFLMQPSSAPFAKQLEYSSVHNILLLSTEYFITLKLH